MIAAGIEILSFLLAQAVGIYFYVSLGGGAGFALMYVFGVASGALGARLSEVWRERLVEKRIANGRRSDPGQFAPARTDG